MAQGKVKWFSDEKGYGFITGDDGIETFVHHTAIQGQSGRRSLKQGDPVTYDVEKAPKGLAAVNVRVAA